VIQAASQAIVMSPLMCTSPANLIRVTAWLPGVSSQPGDRDDGVSGDSFRQGGRQPVRKLEEATEDGGGGIIDMAPGTAGPFIVDPLGELFGCAKCPRVLLKYDPRGVPVIGGPDGDKRRGRIRCPRCRTLCSFPEYEGPPRPGV
jgi:hypothetical protein